jgi:hypothetical protein
MVEDMVKVGTRYHYRRKGVGVGKIRRNPLAQLRFEAKERLGQDQKDNMRLFLKKQKLYNQRKGIRVGDWIKEKNGNYTRVTYIWGEGIGEVQTGGSKYGGYYLGHGHISYSGSLDSGYKIGELASTKEKRVGQIWFFKHDFAQAHNAVEYMMKFRVYRVK